MIICLKGYLSSNRSTEIEVQLDACLVQEEHKFTQSSHNMERDWNKQFPYLRIRKDKDKN